MQKRTFHNYFNFYKEGNLKQIWSLINRSLKSYKKTDKLFGYIIINDKCITDHSEMANSFNNYLINTEDYVRSFLIISLVRL